MSSFKEFSNKYLIRIPLIQRDYVQGLDTNKEKRDKFVHNLLSALSSGNKLSLDFIYGTIDKNTSDIYENGKLVFEPLDGQQRLTTLCVLCLMLSKRSNVKPSENVMNSLRQFSYTTRTSSTKFCEKLFNETADFPISNDNIIPFIEKRPWYAKEWDYDPTVKAMKEIIKLINTLLNTDEFKNNTDLMAKNLYGDNGNTETITFDELNMDNYRLSDTLYIKMNARGKQLTDFENWKASFIRFLKSNYEDTVMENIFPTDNRNNIDTYKMYFEQSIEHQWTDMLWEQAYDSWNKKTEEEKKEGKYPVIDDAFMNLFHYLLKILYFINVDKITYKGENSEIQRDVTADDFKPENFQIQEDILSKPENMQFMFNALDFFHAVKDNERFFNDLFYIHDDIKNDDQCEKRVKVRMFGANQTNLFKACITNNKFTEKDQLLLFCIIKYCIRHKCVKYTDSLLEYVRICRNLLESITQRLTNGVTISSNIRLSEFNKYNDAINRIIENENIYENLKGLNEEDIKQFGMGNIQGEKQKVTNGYINKYIHKIENLSFIRGNLSIFQGHILKDAQNTLSGLQQFTELTTVRQIQILVALGFRGEEFGACAHGTRTFFGNKNKWDIIFTSTKDNTKKAVNQYLLLFFDTIKNNTDYNTFVKSIIYKNIPTEHNFTYYALKYDDFLSARVIWNIKDNPSFYFSVNGALDSCNLIALGNLNSCPLNSYHTEPFASAVAAALKEEEDIYNDLDTASRYNNKASLILKSKRILLTSSSTEWMIRYEEENKEPVSQNILNKFNSDGKSLPVEENGDMISTAIKFILSLYKST